MIKQIQIILFLGILSFSASIYSQDLVFGIDPILLKAGQIELATIGLYIKNKDREKILIGAPRFKWGITSKWEFNITVPFVEAKHSIVAPCAPKDEITTTGVGDIITTLKWQPYASKDKETGSAKLFTLLGGFAFPGNLPGATPLLVEDEVVLTGTNAGCPTTSILVGAATLIVGAPWGLLASFLVGIERENERGNRLGHFFIYSFGAGRKFGTQKFMDIFGLIEFDWIYESNAVKNSKKVPNTSNHIIWFGPNVIINQNSREFKFGIQTPLAEVNIKRDYRIFVAMEWEY